MDTVIRNITTQNWITLLLVGCLILLAIAKSFYAQQYIDILKLAGADRFLNTRAKGSYFFQPLPLVLLWVQFVASALIIYHLYCFWKAIAPANYILIYLYIFIGYSVFEVLKIILERLVGYLLNVEVQMRAYFYKKITIKNWIGLFLLSGCFFLVFGPSSKASVIQIIIGFALLFYFIYNIWLLSSYSKLVLRFPFYFILYFCTLEIAPYFILYKYVTRL